MIAGGAVRAIMECAGINDILTKSLGSTNPHNMVRAAMDGLAHLTTVEQVAEAVGKSRTTVTNLLRLNQLNEDVKRFVEHGDLEMGHARALLALSGPAQSELAKLVAQKGLTVRDTERLVQKTLEPAKAKVEPVRDPQFGYLERQLAEKIGNQVQLQPGKQDSGKLVISYDNLADLDRLLCYFGLSES